MREEECYRFKNFILKVRAILNYFKWNTFFNIETHSSAPHAHSLFENKGMVSRDLEQISIFNIPAFLDSNNFNIYTISYQVCDKTS